MPRLAALLALVSAGCLPEAIELRDDRLTVEVRDVWSVAVDARLPTDLIATDDGGFVVLDGYRGRALVFGADRELVGPIGHPRDWGTPVRMANAPEEGFWIVDPPSGMLRRNDKQGAVLEQFRPNPDEEGVDAQPLALLDLGDSLVVSTRGGELLWVNPLSREITQRLSAGVDESDLGVITDLATTRGGVIIAVDAIRSTVHLLSATGTPLASFGRRGLWAGYLFKPKGVAAAADGTVLVADSALGVVQAYDQDGPEARLALGMLAVDGEPLPLDYPIAIERIGDSGYDFVVLDEVAEKVWGFSLDLGSLAHARELSAVRALREQRVDEEGRVAGVGPRTCLQCHDGLIRDTRQNWDPDLSHHPVGMKPEKPIPPFFPVDEEGRLHCVTCHSPHGVTPLDAISSVRTHEAVLELDRQTGPRSPFTRVEHDMPLCLACHGEHAHDEIIEAVGNPNTHLVGRELVKALEKRLTEVSPDDVAFPKQPPGCLSCHVAHGARGKALAQSEAGGCVACHEEKDTDDAHPVRGQVREAELHPRLSAMVPLEADGGVTCLTCHNLLRGRGAHLVREPADGGEICVVCHRDHEDDAKGAHGNLQSETAPVSCFGCHHTHLATQEQHLLVTATQGRPGDPTGCHTCHGPGGRAEKRGVAPGRYGHPVDGKLHSGGVILVCSTCHDPHQPTTEGGAACGECHEDQAQEMDRGGGHGDMTCPRCHAMHQGDHLSGSADFNRNTRRCLACHAEGTSPKDAVKVPSFQHPEFRRKDSQRWSKLGNLRLFGPNGRALPPATFGDLTCSSCHTTHGAEPGGGLDKLRRTGIQENCEGCHGEDAQTVYENFHYPDKRAHLDVWAD